MNNLKIKAAVSTNVGSIRSRNEDNYYFCGKYVHKDNLHFDCTESGTFDAQNAVFAVCDGMGGINNGDYAASLSVAALSGIEYSLSEYENFGNAIKARISTANESLCREMKNGCKRMGSTLAAIAFHNGRMSAANIGDSRIYKLCNGAFEQLTMDHTEAQSLVNSGVITLDEAQLHPHRNRLTQHIGLFPDEMVIEPYISEPCEICAGEKYLICSDGVYSMIQETALKNILASEDTPEQQCNVLIKEAIKNGGRDNITAVILHIENEEIQMDIKENLPGPPDEANQNWIKKICNQPEKKYFIIRYIILLIVFVLILLIGAITMNRVIDKRIGPNGNLIPVSVSIQ